eukprot:GFUD01006515.1.p1 GENE.GFUD01006515.1~~GFUD01006515.1.p1  ORF type:complete len:424 (-),score=88.15 GFUD01006515.1:85-1356(-)
MPVLKAVILIAGPQKGTRFRPLSLDVPKPLFPVAGLPIVQHHIEACVKVKDLKEILILGFYPSNEMSTFVAEMNSIYKMNIRYLQEYAPLGTAGGIYHFRDQIRAGNPDAFFVMNGDVCADFPLEEMLNFHLSKNSAVGTILGTEATRQQSVNYGCIVEDKVTHAVLHYVEKPNSYISTMINCGVYIFSPEIFPMLQRVFNAKQTEYLSSSEVDDSSKRETIWLERDLIVPLAGTNSAFLYQTSNWWSQIKTAGSAIYANRHYLALYNKTNTDRLTQEGESTPKIIGDVFIHETATVDPSAVLGPNVSIGKNVKIGAGARIRESIILGNSMVGEHTLVLYSVIGWNSSVGSWSRVEGTPDDPNPNKPFAKMENNPLFNISGQLNPSITILGSSVVVPSEVILLNSIVLPHKELGGSYKNQIIL